MPTKITVNWLFNSRCYLLIAYFDWKTGVFKQTIVRAYYILKKKLKLREIKTHLYLLCPIFRPAYWKKR